MFNRGHMPYEVICWLKYDKSLLPVRLSSIMSNTVRISCVVRSDSTAHAHKTRKERPKTKLNYLGLKPSSPIVVGPCISIVTSSSAFRRTQLSHAL